MTKILVTGAAGFIGFHLSKRLCEAGYDVTGLDCITDYYDVNLKYDRLDLLNEFKTFSFEKVDLADREAMEKVFTALKPDIVVNLAAQAGVRYSLDNPYAYVDSNLTGFVNILEECRHHGVKHLVFASSSSVYGANKKVPFSTQDNVDHPVSLYAATKKAGELMAHSYAHLYNLPVTGLRFFTVYGPWGRPDMAYFKFTDKIMRGQAIDVYNHGDMKRDFTYIDDIVESLTRLIEKGYQAENDNSDKIKSVPYRIYNIGNHNPENLLEMITMLEGHLGLEAKKNFLPMQPGDVYETYADCEDLKRDIGFVPETSLQDGLGKFVSWYRSYYKDNYEPEKISKK